MSKIADRRQSSLFHDITIIVAFYFVLMFGFDG